MPISVAWLGLIEHAASLGLTRMTLGQSDSNRVRQKYRDITVNIDHLKSQIDH